MIVGVRPEHLEDAALVPGPPAGRRLTGSCGCASSLGSEVVVHFQVEAAPRSPTTSRELAEDVDDGALLDELDHQRRLRRTASSAGFDVDTTVARTAAHEIAIASGRAPVLRPRDGRRERRLIQRRWSLALDAGDPDHRDDDRNRSYSVPSARKERE